MLQTLVTKDISLRYYIKQLHFEENHVKKIAFALLVVLTLVIIIAAPAFAGGDKVRGDDGQGTVNQVQIMDPSPFQP